MAASSFWALLSAGASYWLLASSLGFQDRLPRNCLSLFPVLPVPLLSRNHFGLWAGTRPMLLLQCRPVLFLWGESLKCSFLALIGSNVEWINMFSFRQASLGYLFFKKKTKPDIKMSGKIRIRLGDLLLKISFSDQPNLSKLFFFFFFWVVCGKLFSTFEELS